MNLNFSLSPENIFNLAITRKGITYKRVTGKDAWIAGERLNDMQKLFLNVEDMKHWRVIVGTRRWKDLFNRPKVACYTALGDTNNVLPFLNERAKGSFRITQHPMGGQHIENLKEPHKPVLRVSFFDPKDAFMFKLSFSVLKTVE